jgi:SNF2 family DNA or RNA helicase
MDEASVIKNRSTGNASLLGLLTARSRLFLTATPVPNARASEFNALLQGLGCTLRLQEEEEEERMDAYGGVYDEEEEGEEEEEEPRQDTEENQRIRALIFDHLVVSSYPMLGASPTGRVLLPEPREERLPEPDQWAYEAFCRTLGKTSSARYLKRMYCISPGLASLDHTLVEKHLADPKRPTPPRMRQVIQYIHEEMAADEKVVVYAKWTRALADLGFHLSQAGISNAFIHGHTTAAQTSEIMHEFRREDGGPRVLLMSDVSKFGTNGLQRANHVIELHPDYVPGEDDQLGGRINRLGQKRLHKMCFVKFLWHNTIEMEVERKNAAKRAKQKSFRAGQQ